MKSWLAGWFSLLFFVVAEVVAGAPLAAAEPAKGDVIGQPAPAWTELAWLGTPLKLEALRGKAVLIRWWSDECPLCKGTLPGLGRLYDQHQKDGLVVIGIYHPKPRPRPVSQSEVKKYAESLGVRFPVAIDADWTVLKRWWLDGRERTFTSVSFLLDRQGTIRWMHRGGEFHESSEPDHTACDASWRELQSKLQAVLK
jgi:peroxiredoxin